MKIANKTILLISPEPWDHIFVSKHHYAITLAGKNNNVFFLNPPSQTFAITETKTTNLFIIDYTGFPPGLRHYPKFARRFFIRRKFLGLQKLCNCAFDIVWSFDNSVFFDFKALPSNTLKISHIVDLNQNFEVEQSADTADICFCTTDAIKKRLSKYNSNVFKIQHGFNDSGTRLDVSLPGKSGIKVLYSGNLRMPYMDWEIIDQIVQRNKNVDFVFIGPGEDQIEGYDEPQGKAKKNTLQCSNVFFIGKVESKALMSYLSLADILLIAYQEKYHIDQANPHKMMEYLGSGKVVVSTKTEEFSGLADAGLVAMADVNSNLPEVFTQVVRSLDDWNATVKQAARRGYALDNTYLKQIERIERILEETICH
jgi:hypothetical protein